MTKQIPPDAFSEYIALGPERSYAALAERYGCSKRSITRVAGKERWAERLTAIEREAQDRADRRAVDVLEEMNERHLRIAKALQAKALRALQAMPLDQAKDVIRALELGVRQERLVRGEPTERQSTIEEVIKREYAQWMGEEEGGDADEEEP